MIKPQAHTRAGLLLWTLLLLPAAGVAQSFTTDIDLVKDMGLVHYAQTDPRWANYSAGPAQTKTIGDCGCMLAALATVLNRQTGIVPWFQTPLANKEVAYDFNPLYLDLFFNFGPSPAQPRAKGWGYQGKSGPDDCGTAPLPQALFAVGTDGTGRPVGFRAKEYRGFGANVKKIVNLNLAAGRPTIVVIRTKPGSTASHHALVIAGWDNDFKAYTVLDPMTPRTSAAGATRPIVPVAHNSGESLADATYEQWETRVEGIVDVTFDGLKTTGRSFVFGDDPSPIEILMTDPAGLRTGFDPGLGAAFEESSSAMYWRYGPWTPPLGETTSAGPTTFIAHPAPATGRYYFKVTGVGNGPLQLDADILSGASRERLQRYEGTIALGEVRKYELDFSRTGASAVRQVANFTPQAIAGEDRSDRTDRPVSFDARRSFDADGVLSNYQWEFGDGGVATGAVVQHVYAAPGQYTVRLTVSDASGATSSDTLTADIILSQRQPTANVSGPYLGFPSTPSLRFPVFLDARGSSDPNGETLSYRWSFGDGSAQQTTSSPYTDHDYQAEGLYTLTLVVNDGIEDSAPVSTTVEIVAAPSSTPFGRINADLLPVCGKPGDSLTLTLGEFAQFDSWDFGTRGALPVFPPSGLPIGVSSSPGTLGLRVDTFARVTVPFSATRLSPGRYVARASIVIPEVAPGLHRLQWGEQGSESFTVPCPLPANRAPLADAGGPYSTRVGAPIRFDGTASSDPEGAALGHNWNFGDGTYGEGERPEHIYSAPGNYLVTLVVNDGRKRSAATAGTRSFAQVVVTAATSDSIPPVTTPLITPAANAAGWHTGDVAVQLRAVDNPGGSGVHDITFALTGAETSSATMQGNAIEVWVAKEGVTTITFHATDNAGNREAPQTRILRIDRNGPAITGLPGAGCNLWPPNHRMVAVADVTANDAGSGVVAGSLRVTATSSEPADATGDGSTEPDVLVNGGKVSVRAERSGAGVGRTYTIEATARDLAGNATRRQAVCVVPHDQSGKSR